MTACLLGNTEPALGRVRNRWVVDADHPAPSARLFFPDLVHRYKGEACRRCRVHRHCEGVVASWVLGPEGRALRPLERGVDGEAWSGQDTP